MNVGERITKLCKEKGMTVRYLEEQCGFSYSYIKHIKDQGSVPGAARLKKVAQFLCVSEEFLLTGQDGEVFPVTDEEREIVTAYRKLTEEQKDMIRRMLGVAKRGRSQTSQITA